jgi:hypothetical protein
MSRRATPWGTRKIYEFISAHRKSYDVRTMLSEMAAAIVEAARRQIKPNYVAAEEDPPSTNASASSGVSATGATASLGDGAPLTLDMLTTGAALRKVAEPTEDDYGADEDEDEDIVDDADDDDEVEAENGK